MKRLLILSLFLTGCTHMEKTCVSMEMSASANVYILRSIGTGRIQPEVCIGSDEEIQDDNERGDSTV